MRLSVTDQSRLLGERFAADVAHVRSDPGVYKQVLLEGCSTSERFVTDGAGVRFVTGVDSHVDFQSAVPREGFPALLADNVLPSLVLGDHVLVKVLLCHHTPLAHLALVLCLVMGELLMNVEGVTVQAGFPADVAYDRLLLVTEAYVIGQVALHLEFLAAGLARELEVVRVFPGDVYLQLVLVLVLVVALVAVKQFR